MSHLRLSTRMGHPDTLGSETQRGRDPAPNAGDCGASWDGNRRLCHQDTTTHRTCQGRRCGSLRPGTELRGLGKGNATQGATPAPWGHFLFSPDGPGPVISASLPVPALCAFGADPEGSLAPGFLFGVSGREAAVAGGLEGGRSGWGRFLARSPLPQDRSSCPCSLPGGSGSHLSLEHLFSLRG